MADLGPLSIMAGGILSIFSDDNVVAGGHQMLEELISPLFFGLIVNYLLWGVQITQSYYYYKTYRKTDRTWEKGAVGLLFFTDLIESICISQACWTFMVDGWGDLSKVTTFPGWGFYATPITSSFTASIVHCFYAQKLRTLLDSPYNHICTALVLPLSLTQLTGAVGGSIFLFSVRLTLQEFFRFKAWACVWLFGAGMTDIVITVLMSWKLSKMRIGFGKTDDIVSQIIRLIVVTGWATAIVQIVDIILFLVWPLKSFHIVLGLIAPKVYSNSMLALLNSRKPRNTTEIMWDSGQDQPVDSINIQAAQSYAVANDYAVNDRAKIERKKVTLTSDLRTPHDAETYTSLSFPANGPDIAAS